MAPEVGLEPTTLRLTASEFVDFPAATGCYKPLSVSYLATSSCLRIATQTCPIMTDFDGAWAQKWAQSIPCSVGRHEPDEVFAHQSFASCEYTSRHNQVAKIPIVGIGITLTFVLRYQNKALRKTAWQIGLSCVELWLDAAGGCETKNNS
jgi:hypothetical protein